MRSKSFADMGFSPEQAAALKLKAPRGWGVCGRFQALKRVYFLFLQRGPEGQLSHGCSIIC
jgi:hypothetical protein